MKEPPTRLKNMETGLDPKKVESKMHLAWLLLIAVGISAFIPYAIKISRSHLEEEISGFGDILIVFAHPDDETMFFLPLILLAQKRNVRFHLLCLTTGDYDGLGRIRSKEFMRVGKSLKAHKVLILNEPRLQDGPNVWETDAVESVIENYLKENPEIGAIFTFDDYGVSGHPNHISVHQGVKALKTSLPRYILSSVSILRKYLPPLDFWITLMLSESRLHIAVNTDEPFKSVETMKLYGSQNVWFRKLFSIFSRYSYINTFQRI